eukprot:CAMPEP_0174762278 /NCGR_PEP_ID=MMETSP1094-20130205/109699_1 /TAXON_ID=156173 /ORGANISM="Chrysochromulina brevifilum, Strain UTEX LB 985" /LENGTH=159 /DNA_ID=CAMNT_0015968231 /DNA_START=108 /DNA_END=587 /DNA_ORIENTATION=+
MDPDVDDSASKSTAVKEALGTAYSEPLGKLPNGSETDFSRNWGGVPYGEDEHFNLSLGQQFDNYGGGDDTLSREMMHNSVYDPYGAVYHEEWHSKIYAEAPFWIAVVACLVCVAQWFIARFTDGIWPNERRLAREQRLKAEMYCHSKKSELVSLMSEDA